jgi:hypothetical protein
LFTSLEVVKQTASLSHEGFSNENLGFKESNRDLCKDRDDVSRSQISDGTRQLLFQILSMSFSVSLDMGIM